MHLAYVTNMWEEGVPEEPMHDVKEGIKHPHLLLVGKILLNKEWHELVLVGRLRVGMRANSNWRVKPFIWNVKQLHELLPSSRQMATISHPSHGPCNIVIVLPHVMHVNVVNVNIVILLGLDHIHVYQILLLVPEEFIASRASPGIHIGIVPSNDKLGLGHHIHARDGLLLFVGGGLGPALGSSRGPLWNIIWVAQTL